MLTNLLERAGAKTIEVNGKRMAGRRWLARALWELVTTGKTDLPGGRTIEAGIIGWFDIAKWLYAQLDGPPRLDVDVTSGGQPLRSEPLTDADRARLLAELADGLSGAPAGPGPAGPAEPVS